MKNYRKVVKTFVAVLLAMNLTVLPICAAERYVKQIDPRYNNIALASLTIGFDTSNVGYFCVSLSPYAHCTGFSGEMKLFDASGNRLKSWAITDMESPYMIEKTYPCEYGKTYTVTFVGYAYGQNTTYDDLDMTVTGTCTD